MTLLYPLNSGCSFRAEHLPSKGPYLIIHLQAFGLKMPHWAKEPKDRKKLDKVDYVLGSKVKLPPPVLESVGPHFDNTVALLSRQYDRDRERIIERARAAGVCGMMCWHPDLDKCEEMMKLCMTNNALCYYMIGIHPDNISRTNKTLQDAWHLKIDEFSRERHCIAVYSGLNITRRDVQSHFAQESMLRCLYHQAKTISIPLVLLVENRESDLKMAYSDAQVSFNTNLSRITDILHEEGWRAMDGDIPIIIQDALGVSRGDPAIMSFLVSSGYHALISVNDQFTLTGSTDDLSNIAACLSAIPRDRVLIGSNSPHYTPHNITDEAIRTSKNEPSNFDSVVRLLAPFFDMSAEELRILNLGNSVRVYKIGDVDTDPVSDKDLQPEKTPIDISIDSTANDLIKLAVSTFDLALPAPVADGDSGLQYVCSKCTTILFSAKHLINQHPVTVSHTCSDDLPETVFDAPVATQQLLKDSVVVDNCSAVYFLPFSSLGCDLCTDSKGNVSCTNCSSKVGRLQGDEGTADHRISCPCGYEVECTGAILRLNTSKVVPKSSSLSKKKDCKEFAADIDRSGNGRRPRSDTKDKDSSSGPEKEASASAAKQQSAVIKPNKKGKSTRKNH